MTAQDAKDDDPWSAPDDDPWDRCEAHVQRGEALPRIECGRPAKGWRVMQLTGGVPVPACGIHMRAKYPLWGV
jgi:hypothetical protein